MALRFPVYLDVIVWNYENTAGLETPWHSKDVDVQSLQAAILASSNKRYGTQTTEFEELLAP